VLAEGLSVEASQRIDEGVMAESPLSKNRRREVEKGRQTVFEKPASQ